MPNLNNRKTPLSDHLHELFETWASDYIFTKAEYTALFEHFELLGSLAYLTRSADKSDLQKRLATPNQDFVWTPIGRAAWDGEVCRPLIEAWKGSLQKPLLDAGFARGDQEFLPLAIQSIERLSRRIGW